MHNQDLACMYHLFGAFGLYLIVDFWAPERNLASPEDGAATPEDGTATAEDRTATAEDEGFFFKNVVFTRAGMAAK